jgi:YfiH family protein
VKSAGHTDWLQPSWRDPRVGSLVTTRRGGLSTDRFDSMNVREGLGDADASVAANWARFLEATGVPVVRLHQVHGHRVVRIGGLDVLPASPVHEADACWTTEAHVGCAVQVADCLPVLMAVPGGVAAAHAGWRGLAAGVLENTLDALCAGAGCRTDQVQAWLGPCIGPGRFEVGADVLRAFGCDPHAAPTAACGGTAGFRFRATSPGKWLANLPGLAGDRLQAAGVKDISGGEWCTFDDASRFFSFRRDGVTGRMVAAIWRRG